MSLRPKALNRLVECPCCKSLTDKETVDEYMVSRTIYGMSVGELADVIQYAEKMGYQIK